MQAKQTNISLFDGAIQDLLKFETTIPQITLLSNDAIFKNLSLEQFRYQVSNLKLSAIPFDYNNALLKISNTIGSEKAKSTVFMISDFQKSMQDSSKATLRTNINYNLVQLQPKTVDNVSIDSVFISEQNATTLTLTVIVKQNGNTAKKPAVSLFNSNLLIAKTAVNEFKNQTAQISFTIKNPEHFIGTLSLEDSSLNFDNSLYFIIDKSSKINVLSIGNQSDILAKLYRDANFNFSQNPLENLDYTKLNSQHLIILNEVELIPPMLKSALVAFLKNGGSLVIIPDLNKSLSSYSDLFSVLNLQSALKIVGEKQLITTINYSHPLFDNVFDKQVQNFDYPSVDAYISLKSSKSSSLIKFSNGDDFISQLKPQNGNLYFVAAPFSPVTNTFSKAPLIVPVFYNIAVQSLANNSLYYLINKQNYIKIEADLKADEVLSLKNADNSFIPLQNIKSNAVVIETQDLPEKPGFYEVDKANLQIGNLAFNLNRQESQLYFYTKSALADEAESVTYFTALPEALQSFKNGTSVFELWKICLAFALLFYFAELLLLKYFNK